MPPSNLPEKNSINPFLDDLPPAELKSTTSVKKKVVRGEFDIFDQQATATDIILEVGRGERVAVGDDERSDEILPEEKEDVPEEDFEL